MVEHHFAKSSIRLTGALALASSLLALYWLVLAAPSFAPTAQAAPQAAPVLAPAAVPLADGPWNANVRVNDASTAGPMPRRQVAMTAISSTGKLYAAWEDERNGDPDIYVAQSSDSGASWRNVTRINHDAPGNDQTMPDIAVSLAGTLHAVWLDNRSGINAVYYATSTNGTTWSDGIRLNDVATATANYPSVAVYGSKVCAAWVDNRYGTYADTFTSCSTDGGSSWGKDERVSGDAAGQYSHYDTDVAVDSSGNPHVVWVNQWGGIYYAHKVSAAWVSSELDTSFTNWCGAPAIAVRDNGIYVAWQAFYSGIGTRISARYSSDGGSTWSASDAAVSDAAYSSVVYGPALAVGPRDIWATWTAYSGTASFLYADKGGATWWVDTIVASATVPFTQRMNSVAAAGTITQVMVAAVDSSDYSIPSWLYNTSWAGRAEVNNTGPASQYAPALGAGSSGNLYAVWNDNRSTGEGLYAAYSTDGGQTWSSNYQVTGTVGAGIPSLAVSGAQTLHLAWRADDDYYWWIKYSSSTDGGRTWGEAQVLTQVIKPMMRAAEGAASVDTNDEQPDIAVYGSRVYVVWPMNGDIYIARSNDGGASWSPAHPELSTMWPSSTYGAFGRVTAAFNTNGRLHLAWQDQHSNNSMCVLSTAANGYMDYYMQPECYYSSAYTNYNPDLAIDPTQSKGYLVWRQIYAGQSSIRVQTVLSDGNWLWNNTGVVTGAVAYPSVATVGDGIVYAAWQDSRGAGDDIYWARSTDDGATWSIAARINDDSSSSIWPQQRPALAANAVYSSTRVWAAWQDFRNINWDIWSASLVDSCAVPLTAAGIVGNSSVEAGQMLTLTGVTTPSNATTPLWYRWEEAYHGIQDILTATFQWNEAGHYTPTLYAGNCSVPVAAQKSILVPCHKPITSISISGVISVQANTLVTYTLTVTPSTRDQPEHILWTPEPQAGQGATQAQYLLKTVGTNYITATAYNCSGESGVASDSHQTSVYDDDWPQLSNFHPSAWYSPPPSRMVPFSVTVQDSESGLDVSSSKVRFTTDGGANWTAWEPIACSCSDGTTEPQTFSGSHYFPQDSAPSPLTWVQFYIKDMAGHLVNPTYILKIDATPPTNPDSLWIGLPVSGTGVWTNYYMPEVYWTLGSDASSGIACYLYGWTQSPSSLPDQSTPGFYCGNPYDHHTTVISSTGNNWYFHVRTMDYAGNWTTSTLHAGPYWIDIGLPTTPPLVSTDPVTGWTNDNTVKVTWGPASDSDSGMAGYSYVWDYGPVIDQPDNVTDTVSQSGGNYYTIGTVVPYSPSLGNSCTFRVSGVDRAGNRGISLAVGPYYLDTQEPPAPSGGTSSVTPNHFTQTNVITVTWTRPNDGASYSGVNAYSFVWSGVFTIPDTIPEITTTANTISRVSGPLADGGTYFTVRARDAAGNWSNTATYGPFLIDRTPPPAPAIDMVWPHTGTPTLDSTIFVRWNRPSESGSGIWGYSFVWDRTPDTQPDETPEIESGEMQASTTSDPLPASTGYYFHVRACDLAHNCGNTTHVGPFEVMIPSGLFASHGSGAPGSDVILTGLAFEPDITVTLYFTKTGNYWSDPSYVRTSPEGTFQVIYMVPPNIAPGPASFVAYGEDRMANESFTVIPGMVMTATPDVLYRDQTLYVTTTNLNPNNGYLVVESSAGHLWGPAALNHSTSKAISLTITHSTISDTYQLTVTNRVNGLAIQRAVDTFHVISRTPPVLVTHPPTLEITSNTGHPGDKIWVGSNTYSDYANTSLQDACSYDSVTPGIVDWDEDGECVGIRHSLRWETLDGSYPTCQIPVSSNSSVSYIADAENLWHTNQSLVFNSNGHAVLNSSYIRVYDGWYDATANPELPVWDVGCEMPHGQYQLCLYLEKYKIWHGEFPSWQGSDLACQPFTVTAPSQFIAPYYLKNISTSMIITSTANPVMSFAGETVGNVGQGHPKPVQQEFTSDAAGRITATLPEGGYQYTAFACGYEAVNGIKVKGRGTVPVSTQMMTPTDLLGPAVLGVEASQETYLTPYGKVGPFMSFKDAPQKPNSVPVTFNIRFNSKIEIVNSVVVTVANSPRQAQPTGNPDYWSITLDMNELPAGDLTMQVQASGSYSVTGGCGQPGPKPGTVFKLPIVMAQAPAWVTTNNTWVQRNLSYQNGEYTLLGSFDKGILHLPVDASVPSIPYLGPIENTLDASVWVTEVFTVASGSWTAWADFEGEATVMCMPGLTGGDCKNVKSMALTAQPAGGVVNSFAAPSFPAQYNAPTTPLLEPIQFGPWTVYQGMIASYWGVINVYLSINFGVETYANVTPGIKDNFEPVITLTPGAVLNGRISLWVDILLGVASAGVDGLPSLCMSLPVTIDGNGATVNGPNVGFKIAGRVWVEALFWEESFGPFEILKVLSGPDCFVSGNVWNAAWSDEPPSVLPAPALAMDGYGHALGTWVHDDSNHPQQNQGELYAAYFDGSTWHDPVSVAGGPDLLVTDPAVAFAGNSMALAVYATSLPNQTQPLTMTDVSAQLADQKISWSKWDGTTWTVSKTLASGDGPRGRVALAGDPLNGRAMAMWIHDVSTPSNKKWQVEYAVYDVVSGGWTTPTVVNAPPANTLDAEVSLAFGPDGKATAVWVRQGGAVPGSLDSAFNNYNQRKLVVATWNPANGQWSVEVSPVGLPTGALMPDIAFDDQGKPMLAYALYLKDRDDVTPTGLGNNNNLGYAVLSSGGMAAQSTGTSTWSAHVAPGVKGVERPRIVILPENQAAILYRGFGAPGTLEFNGVAQVLTVDLLDVNYAATDPGIVTSGNSWMHVAVSTRRVYTGGAQLKSSLLTMGVFNLGGPAAQASMSGARIQDVSLPGDQVLATHVPILPDLSIAEQDIQLAETLPVSGTLVPFTVTVRNLGLARNHQPVSVTLVQDADGPDEKVIASGTVISGMVFNAKFQFTGVWQAESGYHRLTARVRPPIDDDIDGLNNAASVIVGMPAAPTGLAGSYNSFNPSLGLTWHSQGGAALKGYRIYRAEGSDPLTLLTTSANAWFLDVDIQAGKSYRYAVSAVSTADVESAKSAELSIATSRTVYLPIVLR